MSIFKAGIPTHEPMPMPPIMSYDPAPRFFDVEIYYNNGTQQKFSNIEWIGGTDEYIILSKNKYEWYIFKQAVKCINRIRVDSEGE